MTTVDAPNVRAIAVEGTFDDCQDLVKAMFNDAPFRERMRLSAVNSINWARVMAQIVYYVTTARALRRADHGVRADGQLRQRLRRLGRPADGRADRRLHRRLQRQRHPHPLRQRRRHVDAPGRADARARSWTSRCRRTSSACCSMMNDGDGAAHGRAAGALPRDRPARASTADARERWITGAFRAARSDRRRGARRDRAACTPRPGC